MKSKLILGSLLALSVPVIAQNLFPSPSGRVYVNSNGIITGARNALEIYSANPGDNVGIGGSAPGISLYGGTAVPAGAPGSPFSTPYAKIALATAPGHYLTNALAGDFIIQNVGMTSTPISGNGKSIIFSSRFENGNGVEHMRINELGNVGIGTNNIVAKLEVSSSVNGGPGNWGIRSVITQTNTPFSYVPVVGVEGNASASVAQTGELRGIVGTAANGFYNYGGFFQANGSNNGCYGDEAYGIKAIASGGQNTYGIYAVANGISGACASSYAGYFVGSVLRTGGDNFTSDRKLKKDIVLLTNSLEKIMRLKPSSYSFKNDEFKAMNLPQGKQMGLIAQELEEVIPELVTTVPAQYEINTDGKKIEHMPEFKAVSYINLIPLLISGIQEQQKTIETQQKQLDDQKAMIDQLSQKSSNTTGINSINPVETGFQMSQNEPNPFTHETVVKYTLPQTISNAFMAVYDLTGKQITTFPINEKGSSSITITSEKLAAGIYIYSIVADGKVVDSKRMIVAEK